MKWRGKSQYWKCCQLVISWSQRGLQGLCTSLSHAEVPFISRMAEQTAGLGSVDGATRTPAAGCMSGWRMHAVLTAVLGTWPGTWPRPKFWSVSATQHHTVASLENNGRSIRSACWWACPWDQPMHCGPKSKLDVIDFFYEWEDNGSIIFVAH